MTRLGIISPCRKHEWICGFDSLSGSFRELSFAVCWYLTPQCHLCCRADHPKVFVGEETRRMSTQTGGIPAPHTPNISSNVVVVSYARLDRASPLRTFRSKSKSRNCALRHSQLLIAHDSKIRWCLPELLSTLFCHCHAAFLPNVQPSFPRHIIEWFG